MNLLVRSISFALLFAILCGGCSKPGPKLVPAKGTIMVKGKPAGGIAIQFLPDVKESADGVFPSSQAISKEDGSFELAQSQVRTRLCWLTLKKSVPSKARLLRSRLESIQVML